ncbi:MAG: outer membrane lipoprotein carrier protein LolA [Alphaproteobacteria bacterium]
MQNIAPLLRRTAIALLAAAAFALPLACAAPPAFAQQKTQQQTKTLSATDLETVARVEQYLNSFATFEARFEQTGARGAIVRGALYIQRPGRLRVTYDPPIKSFMVATPVYLIYYDGELGEPTYLPLNSTPAGILVQKDIKLSGKLRVADVWRENDLLHVMIVEPGGNDKINITLAFRQEPMQLKEWTVVDAQGFPTRVVLTDAKVNRPIDQKHFDFVNPKPIPNAPK